MTKQTFAAGFLSIAASFMVTSSAQAGLLYASASTAEYQSPVGYDFSNSANDPPTTYQNIGTFTFTPIAVADVNVLTISGTFGNLDYGQTTALSDYYLGDATDGEEAVKVAECDSTVSNPQPDCYAGQEGPYGWSLTLDVAQIADLANGLQAGSIDFGYTWDKDTPAISDPLYPFDGSDGYIPQYVNAGPATLDVFTPEPGTVLFCLGGIAGLAALRRFRKA